MGTILSFDEINKETVENAIKFALESNIQENAKKISYSYKNRPQRPIETAIWWVEHVAATGGAHLTTSHSSFMSWYEYHSVDILALLGSGFIIYVAIVIWVTKKIFGENTKLNIKVKTH